MTEDRPHAVPRISRFLLVVSADDQPPQVRRDDVPQLAGAVVLFKVIGDGVKAVGWGDVCPVAAELRKRADAGEFGESRRWVWVLHDQFFYRTEWQWFACFGPAGWSSAHMAASAISAAEIVKKEHDRREAEKAATRAAALRRKITGEKKLGREVDAIVKAGDGGEF